MRSSAFARSSPFAGRTLGGFTLLELIVVLILLGLASALVAPVLVFRDSDNPREALSSVVLGARKLAMRRGETLELRVGPDGRWRVTALTPRRVEALAVGELREDPLPPAFALLISPLGSCGFDVWSAPAATTISIDPLTCEVGRR